MLGKLFVFSFTWSMGGMFKRQEDGDDDDMIRRGQDKGERDTNICNEFDNFMHELFEVEPPLGNETNMLCVTSLKSGKFNENTAW